MSEAVTIDKEVMIHVRFAPNGSVTEIAERPESMTAQGWFNLLTERVGTTFQALSGGRGVFRIPGGAIAELKSSLAA